MNEHVNSRGAFTIEENHLLKCIKRHLWGLSKRGVVQVYVGKKDQGKIQKWHKLIRNGKIAYQDGGLKLIGDPISKIEVVMLSAPDFRRVVKAVNHEMLQAIDDTTGQVSPLSEGFMIRQTGRMAALLYTPDGEWRWPDGEIVFLAAKFGQNSPLRKRNHGTAAARIDAHNKRLVEAEAKGEDLNGFWRLEQELYSITTSELESLYLDMEMRRTERESQGQTINKRILTRKF